MSNLRIRPETDQGCVTCVTPESAGWDHVGFQLHRVSPGETVSGQSAERETCLVWVTGKGMAEAGGALFGVLGERMSPFDGGPAALYVPAGLSWSVIAETTLELAVCTAPDLIGDLPARVIEPARIETLSRGKGTNVRHVANILPETELAQSLLVVEVITPGGHTSSYPPHKHDTDNLPHESLLEETYYHRLNPPQGFAFQRIYTDDRSLDEAIVIEDGDVTLVPRGYHPCAACHGYDLYYLNVMAGPNRTWKVNTAAEHEWMLEG